MTESGAPTWKPRLWIAAVLALLLPPAGLLYVARWPLAIAYTVWMLAVAGVGLYAGDDSGYYVVSSLVLALASLAHCYFLARRPIPIRPWYSRGYAIFIVIAGSAVLFAGLRMTVIEASKVKSGAMEPGLPRESIIIVSKLGFGAWHVYGQTLRMRPPTRQLQRGELIVFLAPGPPRALHVMRLVGLPGDVISYKDKNLMVNGVSAPISYPFEQDGDSIALEQLGQHRYAIRLDPAIASRDFQIELAAGRYFVLADNRDHAHDSRNFGAIDESQLMGQVVKVFPR